MAALTWEGMDAPWAIEGAMDTAAFAVYVERVNLITVSENYSFIGVEDLNVKGMVKNRKLARALSDAGLGQLLRYISTKAGRHGTPIVKVGRFFPSTKRCHRCHQLRDIPLSERVYLCLNPACGWSGDRDENAAKNILQEAVRMAGRVA